MKKVLFHIDEEAKWDMVIGNVQNMLTYYEQNKIDFQIEILANGKSVVEYKRDESKHAKALELLSNKHVVLAACNNSLMGLNIKEQDLLGFVTIVPAGVVELVDKQDEGYAYIKP